MYKIFVEKKVEKFLSKLDPKSYKIISNAIQKLSYFRELPNLDIKRLKGRFDNMMRMRIASKRILFTVDELQKSIKIWIIEDRGDVY